MRTPRRDNNNDKSDYSLLLDVSEGAQRELWCREFLRFLQTRYHRSRFGACNKSAHCYITRHDLLTLMARQSILTRLTHVVGEAGCAGSDHLENSQKIYNQQILVESFAF